MSINFRISEQSVNELTWEEYETFERAQDGNVKLRDLRPILARFMADDNGAPLEHKKAMAELATLHLGQIKDVVAQFMNALQNQAVPKANGNSSPLPSEATPASEFPHGSG